MSPDSTVRLPLSPGSQPLLTLAPLWQGAGDPQMRMERSEIVRATRTPSGPASVRLRLGRDEIRAEAWGAGAAAALDELPALLGSHDDPSQFQPRHVLLHDLAHRFGGLRMTSGANVSEVALGTIIAQKVTSFEARREHRLLLRRFGEPAPGPLGLTLPPAPERLASLPYHMLHPLGIERRRADTLRAAAAAASSLQEAARSGVAQHLHRRLQAVRGIGPWTSAEIVRLVLGDPDAVSVGDYNLPHLVSWALAGERRGSDARMLELLEPYRGQRARAVLLIELGGRYPPRHGPRLAPRAIAGI